MPVRALLLAQRGRQAQQEPGALGTGDVSAPAAGSCRAAAACAVCSGRRGAAPHRGSPSGKASPAAPHACRNHSSSSSAVSGTVGHGTASQSCAHTEALRLEPSQRFCTPEQPHTDLWHSGDRSEGRVRSRYTSTAQRTAFAFSPHLDKAIAAVCNARLICAPALLRKGAVRQGRRAVPRALEEHLRVSRLPSDTSSTFKKHHRTPTCARAL